MNEDINIHAYAHPSILPFIYIYVFKLTSLLDCVSLVLGSKTKVCLAAEEFQLTLVLHLLLTPEARP